MTQTLYQKAMKFAGEKHKDQKVPGTEANYLLHISNVAMEIFMAGIHNNDFDLDYAIQVAVLHDVLEDTETSIDELSANFGERVAVGVKALTKDDTLSSKEAKISDSLSRINLLEKEVGMVKLADRITNLQEPPKTWDQEKIKKYLGEAQTIAASLKGKNEYLNARLEEKIRAYHQFVH